MCMRNIPPKCRWCTDLALAGPLHQYCAAGEVNMTLNESLCDLPRVNYLRQVIGNASLAVQEDGVDLRVSASPSS